MPPQLHLGKMNNTLLPTTMLGHGPHSGKGHQGTIVGVGTPPGIKAAVLAKDVNVKGGMIGVKGGTPSAYWNPDYNYYSPSYYDRCANRWFYFANLPFADFFDK